MDLDAALTAARAWAGSEPRLRAIALVGSHARGSARPDSDVDLVVLCTDTNDLATDETWHAQFGRVTVVRRQTWGFLTECRLATPTGLELDIGITPLTWAAVDPIDAGTRRVVSDGACRIVYDPDERLSALLRSATSS